VLLVSAPPGFGKSVLLEQWSAARSVQGVRCAWLTLDPTDDVESSILYLAFALHASGLDLTGTSLFDEGKISSMATARRLQHLVAVVERSGQEWCLVLDDLERASPAVVAGVIEPLVRFMPECLTIALGARHPGTVNLSDAADRGLVFTLRAAQLRLDRDEVRAVLGSGTTPAHVSYVEQQTAGWPALVQLFREQGLLSTGGQPAEPLDGDTALTAFFETRILERLDEAQRQVLMRLSMLPHFSADLTAELLGTAALRELESLERLGIVHRISDASADFAVRPVFRDYFARRFLATAEGEARELQRRGAQSLLQRGLALDAIRLAAAIGDPEVLADVVEVADPLNLWLKQGMTALNGAMRVVPDELARRRPRLGYARVVSWVKVGRIKDARQLFEHLEPLTDRAALRLREPCAPVLTARALCHSMLAVYGGIPVSLADIEELEWLAERSVAFGPTLAASAATLRCYELQHAGAFAEAKRVAQDCIRHAGEADSRYLAFFMYCDLAMMSGVEGRTTDAFEYFERGDRDCQAEVRADERLSIVRDVFKLELEHEMNPLDNRSAARLQNICVRLPRLEGWLDIFAAAFRTYSEKLFLAKDLATALATLSVGIDVLREQEIDSVANMLLAQRVFLLALAGRRGEAREEFSGLEAAVAAYGFRDRRSWREMEAFVEASAAIDLVSHTGESLSMLSAQIEITRATGNVRSELRLRRLRSALCGVDEAPDDPARIHELESTYGLNRSAALLEARSAQSIPVTGGEAEFFTERERQILERLAADRSDKAIALELGISPHGVRYHLKRIYAKLNVRGRTDARSKALQLGIRL
jgi:LuxR family maltose regulon positive regulatory protein